MSISPQNICPSCKKANETGMTFCIHCGEKLNVASSAKEPSELSPLGFTCTSCGKTDPLNKYFCVHCGAKTTNTNYTPKSTGLSAGEHKQAPGRSIESQRTSAVQSIFGNVFIAILLGLIVGIISGRQMSTAISKLILENLYANKNLIVFTGMPAANITMSDDNDQYYIAGETSDTGEIGVSNLKPGKYHVSLANGNDRQTGRAVKVGQTPYLLGFPKRIE